MPQQQPFHPTRISRRGVLGGAAAVGLAGTAQLVGGPVPAAADPARQSSVVVDRVKITRVADLTGPEITGRFGVHWTDLGIPARCPDGRVIYVFGDTFAPNWGQDQRSPTALWSDTRRLSDGITFDATPEPYYAEDLISYDRSEISTIIPSDVITLGDTLYLHGVANFPFGTARWSGIWTSTDNGVSWVDSGARFPADAYDQRWQHATWELGADGWVYVYTAKFLRQTSMILHRVRPEQLTDPAAWQPWGRRGDGWAWGAEPTPVTDDIIGEASLRRLGDRWLLTWFDGPGYRIAAQVLDHPTQDLRATPTRTLLHGTDWDSQDVDHLAQLYGSYIVPGSRIDDVHLTVSQWNTADNSVYHVLQYRFQGLGRASR